jgi:3-dehydroquinate dehydratase
MKQFIRTQLPDSIVYNNQTYTFFSALDRKGIEAEQTGIPVIKVRIDNKKRRESRRMHKHSNGHIQIMKYDNPTDYYYTVKN